ncbi:hypothetical protein SUGI_0580060 [Cryptomeria japonica]|nr:hypothetical protein SUGI_0580060 [Cryptomeria japonica]
MGSANGVLEIDLTECIENEKVIFDQHGIIVKFLGPKLSRKEIQAWVLEDWGSHIMVKFLPKGFFVVVFPCEEDRDHIITLQNWFQKDHPLYIQSWSPNFDPTSIATYDKPMWIHLYNLPIEYWSEAYLEMIRRSLGTLLEIDEEIVEGDLYTYARLKIAAIKAIPSLVMLLTADGNWKQHFEIEKEIEVCSQCGSKFHNTANAECFDAVVYPIDEPVVEEDLQISELDTVEQGSDDDNLNIVDPRHISQSANIILES